MKEDYVHLAPVNESSAMDPNVYDVFNADRTLCENSREYLDYLHVIEGNGVGDSDSYLKTNKS